MCFVNKYTIDRKAKMAKHQLIQDETLLRLSTRFLANRCSGQFV